MMKKALTGILAGAMVLSMASSLTVYAEETDNSDRVWRVGISCLSNADENCHLECETFQKIVESDDFAKAVGHEVSVEWTDSQKDISIQTSNVETMIQKGIDALFLIGVDKAGNSAAVEACNKAGVQVFTCACESESGDYIMVGFDERQCGFVQGEYVAEHAEEGDKICYMIGEPGNENTILRKEGFMEGIASRDDIEVISEQSGMYNSETAMQVMEDWVTAYGDDIDWVVTQDNQMAQGVIEVLKAADKIDNVRISSWIVPGTWDADYIRNGEAEQAVYVSFETLGETAAEVLEKYYNGEEIENPTYMNLYSITEENFDEFFGE